MFARLEQELNKDFDLHAEQQKCARAVNEVRMYVTDDAVVLLSCQLLC